MERYHQWLADPAIDEATKEDLRKIAADEKEIKERFYKDLEFGTGGLRGIIGAGSNRLNRYTVGRATQGLANYILKEGTQDKGVAIAYDSRHMSPEFAQIAGLVLAGNGIRAYVYPSLRPTPMLSFAVRELGCTAGIVITASHNPPEYNGYKVYWADGAQVVAPRDKDIIAEVNAVASFGEIKEMTMDEAQAKGLFQYISEDVDNAFDANVLAQRQAPEIIEEMADDLKIVYTPIHGSGNLPVRRALEKAGFHQVYVVKEQEMPDSDFTTVGYPNPEDPKVFVLAQKLAEMKRRKRKLVDPLQFEMSIQAEDLAGYVPAFGWEMAPPSDGQKKTLEKLGILPDEIDNAGKASKLLERLDKRRQEGLTTPKQIRFLESRGFQHVGTWQFDTAKKLIDRIARNGWKIPRDIIPSEYKGA